MNDAASAAVQRPDTRAFWRWVLAAVRPVAGWVLVGVGALVLLLGWIGVSGEVLVSKQLPYLVSGGFGGLGTIALGTRLLLSEDLRTYEHRMQRMEHLVDDLHELLLIADIQTEHTEQTSIEHGDADSPVPSTNGTGVVVLETGSRFHRPDCRLMRNKDGAENVTPAIALERGMKPCGVCRPPTPAMTVAPMEH